MYLEADDAHMSTLNSDSKFEWSILSNSGDTLGAKVDKPSKSGFVVKAQPFNLNHIRCSVDIGRLILGMIPVSRQDVDADIVAVNPQSKFCRSILYDKRDAILVPKLDKISEGRFIVEAQRFYLIHSSRCPDAIGYLELSMVAISGENVDRIYGVFRRNGRIGNM